VVETLVDHAAPGDGEQSGLLHGRIRHEGAVAVLDHALTPWLLGDAALASSYNTAYERVYPGALTELGIPATALTGRKAREQWLTWTPGTTAAVPTCVGPNGAPESSWYSWGAFPQPLPSEPV
jgi:hypothetical protein